MTNAEKCRRYRERHRERYLAHARARYARDHPGVVPEGPRLGRPIYLHKAEGRPPRWVVRCRDGSRTYFYRAVVESAIRRHLRADEWIHHRNGDSTDDRIENLQIVTPSQHGELHGGGD